MSEEKVRVDFNAPEPLVREADAVAELLDTSRTRLLVDGLRKQLDDVAGDEGFQRRIREAFYEDRISYETVASVLGTEEAMRTKLLRDSLDREPIVPDADDVDVPDAEEFYAAELQTWQPDEERSEGERSADDLTDETLAGEEQAGDETERSG